MTASGAFLSGVSGDALSLALAPGSTLCVVAAADAPGGTPSFVLPVGIALAGQGGAVAAVTVPSASDATRVCATVPSLAELCVASTVLPEELCLSRGECSRES
jgi:hypothetical protein